MWNGESEVGWGKREKKVEKKRVRNLRGVWQEGLYASEII